MGLLLPQSFELLLGERSTLLAVRPQAFALGRVTGPEAELLTLAVHPEARRRGLVTVALVGYDGGRIAAEGLADHVVVTRSEHIPRIQEAQASAWHVLRSRM